MCDSINFCLIFMGEPTWPQFSISFPFKPGPFPVSRFQVLSNLRIMLLCTHCSQTLLTCFPSNQIPLVLPHCTVQPQPSLWGLSQLSHPPPPLSTHAALLILPEMFPGHILPPLLNFTFSECRRCLAFCCATQRSLHITGVRIPCWSPEQMNWKWIGVFSVVLTWKPLFPQGDISQCLETFFFFSVTTGLVSLAAVR
jgi:hypothetical protein